MPIGSGKIGLFGGGVSIEAGCQTFNAPGTFTVPDGLQVVTLSGNGSTSNAGNPGNAGAPAPGGAGGNGGVVPPSYIGNNRPWAGGGRSCNTGAYGLGAGVGGAGGSPGVAPGGPGNPGNPGGPTTVFGYCWTGGAVGNGGAGGVNGGAGNPGGGGVGFAVNFNPAPNYIYGSPRSGGNYTGPNADNSSNVTGGRGSGGRRLAVPPPGGATIYVWCNRGYGGGGGGGAGAGPGSGACGPTSSGSPFPANGCNGGLSGSPGGGSGGRGNYSAGGNQQRTNTGNPGTALTEGGGGGGGGGGGSYALVSNAGAGSGASGGGGGGGGGSVGNPGSGCGNPGGAGNPATYNCVPVNTGCYPVSVGTGGQVNISWNAQ